VGVHSNCWVILAGKQELEISKFECSWKPEVKLPAAWDFHGELEI
jgi:hypothetical protein